MEDACLVLQFLCFNGNLLGIIRCMTKDFICFLFCFIIVCEKYFRIQTTLAERIAAGVGALCCIIPVYVMDFIGLALFLFLIVSQQRRVKREGLASRSQA